MRARPSIGLRVVVATGFISAILLVSTAANGEPGFAPTSRMFAPTGASDATAYYNSVSCPTPTWCAASGYEQGGSGLPMVATESNGAWSVPAYLSVPAGAVSGQVGVACPAPGDCVAGGAYVTPGERTPAIAVENSGAWGPLTALSLPSGAYPTQPLATLGTPWCQSVGNCIDVGSYQIAYLEYAPFYLTESAGAWSPTVGLPPGSGEPTRAQVSCTSLGNCIVFAGDTYTETAGVWSPPKPFNPALPRGASSYEILSATCPNASTCLAVGFALYGNFGPDDQPVAATTTQTHGTWGALRVLPRPQLSPQLRGSELWSISCAPNANTCVAVGAGGNYSQLSPGYHQPISVTWSNGSWSSIDIEQLPVPKSTYRSASVLDDVSCTADNLCVAVGNHGWWAPGDSVQTLSGAYSSSIVPVRQLQRPRPPTNATVTPVTKGVIVRWSPPLDDGGSPVISYTAELSPGGARCTTLAHSCTFRGLATGRRYVATVTARTSFGTSIPERAGSVVPK